MPNTLIWIPKRLVETSLLNIAALNPASFAKYCEQEYVHRVNNAAAATVESGASVIMLSGPSASGKTTTAHKVSARLKQIGIESAVVSVDCFYKEISEYPLLPNGKPDYESVNALDVAAVNRAVCELCEKGETLIPDFDFKSEQRTRTQTLLKLNGGVAVIEGIHALNPILTDALPHKKVYRIYAGLREEYSFDGQRAISTRDIRLIRRMIRDVQFRGHSIDKTLDMWDAVCSAEDKLVKAFKQDADILLDTSFSYEPNVIAGFVQDFKAQIDPSGAHAEQFAQLCRNFDTCTAINTDFVPKNSILREFLGGYEELINN